ncbi:TIGR00297 family protein [Enterococcus moraviensis ATCC BAA-383]|uniref:TIGR00297 family protein n=1 Tax=Enterococcus moraviensis ATCC BAA-383 TaxID=1158609 RepID=R2QNT9_9ENTE|nr:DUF92 domain-containing protein [Enterococcus moraviensis]EOH96868.1 TIGR00297 family protein [Enterococcus moraviensis ATCC BAA-383]EOT71517.1 TIGR00297 family protein [Enterococcus moraviensis ATCC BAA-383]OJG68570.1 TIGR00297 family protein [Enterococcus moraviensis]
MTILFYKLFLGFIVGSLIGLFSYITHLLTKSGMIAIVFVATIVCGFGSWFTWGLLILFFCSSGCIHLAKKRINMTNLDTVAEKGHTRDALQVLANSLPAIISLVLFYYTKNQLFLIGYASGIAGATADTWSSEIGILSKSAPRSIISFKPIQPGLSGGVSLLGTIASSLGSLLISVVFWLLYRPDDFSTFPQIFILIVPFICGIFNSLVDSLLGATLQAKYRCSICGQLTENKQHHFHTTQQIGGLSWLTNDWVNFFSGCLTVLFSWIILFYAQQ